MYSVQYDLHVHTRDPQAGPAWHVMNREQTRYGLLLPADKISFLFLFFLISNKKENTFSLPYSIFFFF